MRIALASIHPRALSGQIEGLVGLAQTLEQQGHHVQVVSAFANPQLLGGNRLDLARVPHRIVLDQPSRMIRVLVRLIRLANAVDVIQLNLPTPAFAMFADLLQTCVQVPVVVGYEAHLANARELVQKRYLFQAPGFYLMRLLINNRIVARITLKRAAHYVVHSQFQQQELSILGIAPTHISVLPPILPTDKLERTYPERKPSQVTTEQRITYIGHYNHVKGVDILIQAFQLVAARRPNARLVLAWSGIGGNQHLQHLLAECAFSGQIVQLGQVSVPEVLATSGVVVLPYRLTIGQAAYPATLLEAMAANVPVITSDLPLLRELTQDGKLSLLVRPNDPAQLAVAMEQILSDSSIVQPMLQAQRVWAQHIQPALVVKEYERLYARLIHHQT